MEHPADTMELADTTPPDVSASSLRRVSGHSAWLSASSLVSAAFLLAQGVIVTRALGPADFGMLAIVVGVVTVVRLLLSFRMNEVVVKYVADAMVDRDYKAASATVKGAAYAEALGAFAACGAAVALAPWAARAFAGAQVDPSLIALYALIVLPASLFAETSLGVLQAFGRFDVQSLVQMAERSVVLAATAGALLVHGGLEAFLVAAALGPAVSGILMVAVGLIEAQRRFGDRWYLAPLGAMSGRWGSMGRFAVSTNLSATLSLITKEADVLWLGWLRTPIEVGYYRLAYSLANLAVIPVAPLAQAVFPEVAQLAAKRRWGELRFLVRRSSRIVAAYAAVVLIISLALAPELILEVYGPAFVPAAPTLTALLVGISLGAVAFWARPILLAANLAPFTLFATFVAVIVKVTGVLLFVPRYGIEGNAWVLTATYLVGTSLLVWRVGRVIRRPTGT